jgi:hypothetical protein
VGSKVVSGGLFMESYDVPAGFRLDVTGALVAL